MIIGIPKEIKKNEYRVSCNPDGVYEIIKKGHQVLIEKGAGNGSGYTDKEYVDAGGKIIDSAKEVYDTAEVIYKVKEVFLEEFQYLKAGHILFTYIHSNAYENQTKALLNKKVTGIAYEDIDDKQGEFPLLKPMSIIAGMGGFIAALNYSQKIHGGNGILLSRVDGVKTPHVTIIGAGNAGYGAAKLAASLENKVSILDINIEKLEEIRNKLPGNVELLLSNKKNLEMCIEQTDVLINCILWPKDRKDHLIDRGMLSKMKRNSVIVDVACDEHGAIETSHATSHSNPVYIIDGIQHYCVDNIPAAFAQTATTTLCNATLPYLLKIADVGVEKALIQDKHLRKGLTTYNGKLTLEETGKKLKIPYISPEEALGM